MGCGHDLLLHDRGASGVTGDAAPADTPDPGPLRGRRVAVTCGGDSLRRELSTLVASWGAHAVPLTREQLAAEAWDTAVVDVAAGEIEAWRQLFAERPGTPVASDGGARADRPVRAPDCDALRAGFRALIRKPPRHEALCALLAASLRPGPITTSPFGTESRPSVRLGLQRAAGRGQSGEPAADPEDAREPGLRLGSRRGRRRGAGRGSSRGSTTRSCSTSTCPRSRLRGGRADPARRAPATRNRTIRIVALAADAQEARGLALSAGSVNACIARPFSVSDLDGALRRGLGRSANPLTTPGARGKT